MSTATATGVGRAGALMAVGTVASRATGFLRTIVMLWALGSATSLANVYNITNVIPNVLYDLLLGGILGAVLIPVLLQAARDEDGGDSFTRTLLTLSTLVLGTLALVSIVAAPAIASLYGFHGDERATAVLFLRYFLPQVLFYGLSALSQAILNARGSFTAPMIAPVATNAVTILAYLIFIALPGGTDAAHLTTAQTVTLGLGTTLGIAAMFVAVIPALRSVGVSFSPTLDLHHPGLRDALRLSGFVLGYAAVNQVGYLIIVKLSKDSSSFTPYSVAYQVLQLPHAIIAVSILTALGPRIASAGNDGQLRRASFEVAKGARMLVALLTPAAVCMLVLGPAISIFGLAHGETTTQSAKLIGETMMAFGAGLVPFSLYALLIRAFYSLKDTRTPFLINIVSNVINVVFDAVAVAIVPKDRVAVWLAIGLSFAYLASAVLAGVVLARRTGDLRGPFVRRTIARCVLAGTIAGVAGALAGMVLAKAGLHETFGASFVRAVVGGLIVIYVYMRLTRQMHVREVAAAVLPITAALQTARGRRAQRQPRYDDHGHRDDRRSDSYGRR